MVGDKLVIINGEEDMLVCHISSFRYIKEDRETLETPFQALEITAINRWQDVQKK